MTPQERCVKKRHFLRKSLKNDVAGNFSAQVRLYVVVFFGRFSEAFQNSVFPDRPYLMKCGKRTRPNQPPGDSIGCPGIVRWAFPSEQTALFVFTALPVGRGNQGRGPRVAVVVPTFLRMLE
jgi:hypothetical protein